eukprot:53734-Hanusia_phi.AAC.1
MSNSLRPPPRWSGRPTSRPALKFQVDTRVTELSPRDFSGLAAAGPEPFSSLKLLHCSPIRDRTGRPPGGSARWARRHGRTAAPHHRPPPRAT